MSFAVKTPRIDEPKDPKLRQISRVIPDAWIDQEWPAKASPHQRRLREYRTSQLVRIHLLLLIKRIDSFNELCAELVHNRDLRRFCRLSLRVPAPVPATLSKWREQFGFLGWRKLHTHLVRLVLNTYPAAPVGVLVMDATDLPAAVRRTRKKKTIRPMHSV